MKHLTLLSAMLLGCGSGAGTLNEYQPCQPSPDNDASDQGSSTNYVLTNNCIPLTNVSVHIEITQDIITSNGFSFQLNGAVPKTIKGNQVDIQQYTIIVDPTGHIWASIDDWVYPNQLINQLASLYVLPTSTVPAGLKFQISLHNDTFGNISGANYTVFDINDEIIGNVSTPLSGLPVHLTTDGGVVQNTELSPIVAYTFNLVGADNGQSTMLYFGAGVITYSSVETINIDSKIPACALSFWTLETSNSRYGLPVHLTDAFKTVPNQVVQSFGVCQEPIIH